TVSDLGPLPPLTATGQAMLESRPWPVATTSQEVKRVDLWRPLFDVVSSFDHATVFIVDGEHPNGDALRFESNGGFEALAVMRSGEWRSLSGKMQLTWRRAKATTGEPVPAWQITAWKTVEMHYIASPKRLFVEAVDTALRVPDDRTKVQRSGHHD